MARNFGKQKVEDPTLVPQGLLPTFFGRNVPDDVRLFVPLLHQASATVEVVRGCITKVIEHLKSIAPSSSSADSDFVSFQRSIGHEANELGFLYSGIYCILHAAIASKVNTTKIVEDLKKMNIPQQVADDLGRAILRSRNQLEMVALHSRIRFPKLDKLRWRIDVIISSGSLSKVMRPSILMQMILSDGRIETFEVSQQEFHQVRYGVAKMLREMQVIERHPIMRVALEYQKREDAERNT